MDQHVTDSIVYIGVDDKSIDLFESQYAVPNGISYNSYVILDEKTAVMDTVDARGTAGWLDNLTAALDGRPLDYLVVLHMEPDHSGSLKILADKYPDMKIVGNAKTFTMMQQFFALDLTDRMVTVKEGDTLSLGAHTLQFVMAPMVHWPEVMVAYEQKEKILFAADAFGKFGALDTEEPWDDEARRYYINIVGKNGLQEPALLKKAAALDIAMICPLHGPILKENLPHYIEKYNIWSSYAPEEEGVLIACASIHGHTMQAAKKMAEILEAKGARRVKVLDLARDDMALAVSEAFRYDRLLLAAASYNADVFPCMETFLLHLRGKNYQKRAVGLLENGTWAPSAGKCMKEILSKMKDIRLCEQMVTVKSAVKEADLPAMEALAEELLSK